MVPHLQKLYKAVHSRQKMTPDMRKAIVTLIFKSKGSREDWRNYRPVSVTTIEYRIMGRAIHQAMRPMMEQLLGESQIGFLSRQIDEHILCVTELAHYCESNNKPGLFVALDNVKAYDRVQHSFLQKVLEAFGFPSEFRQLINTMYTDIESALKVNGHIGKTFPVTNSLRQGCSLSCQLYLLVHEVLLRMIRESPDLRGIDIPNEEGRDDAASAVELRERAFADDTGIALGGRDPHDQIPKLFKVVQEYNDISGSATNMEKSFAIQMGAAKKGSPPAYPPIKYVKFGEEEMPDKYLGVKCGSAQSIAAQWAKKIDDIEAECTKAMQCHAPKSVFGRAIWTKNVFASKAWYTFKLQVPGKRARGKLLARLQKVVNRAYFGNHSFVQHTTAKQSKLNGGINMLDVRTQLDAEYVKHVTRLIENPGANRPWKNFWKHSLRKIYGDIGSLRLVTSSCKFEKVTQAPSRHASRLLRACLEAWASIHPTLTKPRREVPPATKV
jgi:hypothetical protein